MKTTSDVVIVGGGPAGSTAATFLARKGLRVMVLEKERFPREHVGESLLPYCYSIFEELGVLGEMSARFVRKPGVRFIDVDGRTQTTWCFQNVIKNPSYLSFHVVRSEFDELLLNNAERSGATVRQETRVREVDLKTPGGGVTVRASGPRGGNQVHGARFLIDASGRDTFMASRMKAKQPHPALDRASIFNHWTGLSYDEGFREGLLHIVYLGGDKQGWIWAMPLGADRVSVGVVLNHSYLRDEKRRLQAAGTDDWLTALYMQEIEYSPFTREFLSGARTMWPAMFNGDYSYTVTTKYGRNFALVGDASAFIDPIFSSGVHLSMTSARMVADAVATRLGASNGDGEEALRTAYRSIDGAYSLVDGCIRLFYNREAVNFAQLGPASELLHSQQETALATCHYMLAGDFFENWERYQKFLGLLNDPRVLRRYRTFVVDRPEFQATSCARGDGPVPRRDPFGERLVEAEERLFSHYGLAMETGFVEAGDPPVRTRVLSTGAGPPLMLVQGGGGSSAVWAPLMAHLGGFRLLAVERPGSGLSEPFDYRGVDLRTHAEAFLASVMERLGLGGAPFVASSMGGLWTIWLAQSRPESVRAMIQLGCPALIGTTSAPLAQRFAGVAGLQPAEERPSPARIRRLMEHMVGRPAADRMPTELAECLAIAEGRWARGPTRRSLIENALGPTGSRPGLRLDDDQLRRVSQPTLYLWGERDTHGSPEVGEHACAVQPDARIVAFDAGHLPWLDDPSFCAREIVGFLRERAPTSGVAPGHARPRVTREPQGVSP